MKQERVFPRPQGWELEPGSAGRWAPGGPCLVAEVRWLTQVSASSLLAGS